MSNMMKSISIVLVILMQISVCSAVTISASTEETFTSGNYEYKLLDDGTAEITKYNGSDTEITIPSELDVYTVTSIGTSAFAGSRSITSITIPVSVTSIGYYAFYDCTNLSRVTILDSVTSISGYAFQYCKSLTSITIPDSVISIGYLAFSDCTNLENVIIGNSVETIYDAAFMGCEALKEITIPDSVTSIGIQAFDNTAYYKDGSNWENDVLYINHHLIEAKKNNFR